MSARDLPNLNPVGPIEEDEGDACPCGGGGYATCCGPYHAGTADPPTAEALMRARYSAYARGDGVWLARTQRAPADPETLAAVGRATRWLGLHVFLREAGGAADAEGRVGFIARYQTPRGPRALVEVSRFDRMAGHWRYTTGAPPRLGPASRCPCGSQSRFGRCCGRP